MRLFGGLYQRVLMWSRHRHAPRYLFALSFAESSFFPIPPDVMLAPMALAKPERAWYFALLTTLASVAGGIAGYLIGMFALDWATPLLQQAGYFEKFVRVGTWFDRWGFWVVFAAGFSPIPYKLFTITAGAVGMSLPVFALASFISRGARFFLIAGLIRAGGPQLEARLLTYIDRIAIGLIVVAGIAWLVLRH